jgi:hypothetical protein
VDRRGRTLFLLLILAQAAHSVEEYAMGLFAVFAPARLVSSLFSADLATGFLVANTILCGFGFACWALPVRSGWRSARGVAWFWAYLELGNGIGHSLMAVATGGYFPGALTAPLLFGLGGWLAALLARTRDPAAS